MCKKSWKRKLSLVIAGILMASAVDVAGVFGMSGVSAASVSPKTSQKLTAKYDPGMDREVKRNVGDKFRQSIKGAKTRVTYTSSNKSVATITKVNRERGGNWCEITCVGIGRTVITATAQGDDQYKGASKSFNLYVAPKTAKIISLRSNAKRQVTIMSDDAAAGCDGYEILYVHDKKITKLRVKGSGPLVKTIKGLRSGKQFRVRIRTYKEKNGRTYYGRYSGRRTLSRVR